PFRHAGGERLGEPQCRFDVDGLDMAPGRGVRVGEGYLVERRGAVDEYVAATVALEHRGCGGPGGRLGPQVAGDVPVTVKDDGAVPGAVQCSGDGGSDRARAAGDDRDSSMPRIQCGSHGLLTGERPCGSRGPGGSTPGSKR